MRVNAAVGLTHEAQGFDPVDESMLAVSEVHIYQTVNLYALLKHGSKPHREGKMSSTALAFVPAIRVDYYLYFFSGRQRNTSSLFSLSTAIQPQFRSGYGVYPSLAFLRSSWLWVHHLAAKVLGQECLMPV
jgi:hypothetical protein